MQLKSFKGYKTKYPVLKKVVTTLIVILFFGGLFYTFYLDMYRGESRSNKVERLEFVTLAKVIQTEKIIAGIQDYGPTIFRTAGFDIKYAYTFRGEEYTKIEFVPNGKDMKAIMNEIENFKPNQPINIRLAPENPKNAMIDFK